MTNAKIECPQCHFEFDHGVHVCQGCVGDVLYGATAEELRAAFQSGFSFGVIGSGAFFVAVPALLNGQLSMSIPFGFGLGFWAVMISLAVGVYSGMTSRNHAAESRRGVIRVRRRR